MFPEWMAQFGFAAVMSAALLWILHGMMKAHAEERQKQNQEHSNERSEWRESDQNTRNQFVESLKNIEDNLRK